MSVAVAGILALAGCATSQNRADLPSPSAPTSPSIWPTGIGSTADPLSPATSATPAASATGAGTSAASVDPRLVPLIAGHNQPRARRINIVFVEHGAPKGYDWIGLARTLLAWDGPTALYIREVNGVQQFSTRPDGGRVDQRGWGPFSVDPFRSNRDLFNVWAFTTPEPTATYYTNDGHRLPVTLRDTVVVQLAWDWSPPAGWRVPPPPSGVADPPPFYPPALPKAGSNPFNGVTISINQNVAYSAGNVVTHELGHALFNLPDEYIADQTKGTGGLDRSGSFYPDCAANRAEATKVWGDLVGQVDPMFDVWEQQVLSDGGTLDDIEYRRMDLKVDYVEGGCFGRPGTYRATLRGIMYDQDTYPVFGSVDRRWAERVLAVWR